MRCDHVLAAVAACAARHAPALDGLRAGRPGPLAIGGFTEPRSEPLPGSAIQLRPCPAALSCLDPVCSALALAWGWSGFFTGLGCSLLLALRAERQGVRRSGAETGATAATGRQRARPAVAGRLDPVEKL